MPNATASAPSRLGRRIGFRDVEIVEMRESRAQEVGKRMIEESIAIANVIPDKAAVVILDERGESLDSAALAAQLGKWRDDGRPAAVFIIGGDDGLAPSLARARRAAARVRRRDLAASTGAGHAARAALPRDHASWPGTPTIAPENMTGSRPGLEKTAALRQGPMGASRDIGRPIRIAR